MKAGVVGNPITHSLSPLIHGAWLAEAGLSGSYERYEAPTDGFAALIERLKAEGLAGVNVTLPFKEEALGLASRATDRAQQAGAANLLIFRPDGRIIADNTDGEGMLAAIAAQAPGFDAAAGPAVVWGAGGAARGAVAALLGAGAPQVRVVNRSLGRAQMLAAHLGERVSAHDQANAASALAGAALIVNATSAGLADTGRLDPPFEVMAPGAVAMDMVYKPVDTAFLQQAAEAGLRPVDGLEMLIRQAIPSFEAFYGEAPYASVDVRALCLESLRAQSLGVTS